MIIMCKHTNEHGQLAIFMKENDMVQCKICGNIFPFTIIEETKKADRQHIINQLSLIKPDVDYNTISYPNLVKIYNNTMSKVNNAKILHSSLGLMESLCGGKLIDKGFERHIHR